MSFTIFQNKKTPLQSLKTKRLKSQKQEIFLKGLTHGFNQWSFSQLFFQAKQARKMSFTIFQKEQTPLQAIKTRISESRKIDIFPEGLTHGFGSKMAIFPTFFFRQNRSEKFLLRYSIRKKLLSMLLKQEVQKVEKLLSFQRWLTHRFGEEPASF